jgi:methionyl-tRNA formyltransferase
MKIVFMGTPEFAVESLKALLEADHDVCAVVTVPDKKQGRGLKVKASAVKQFATERGIPVLQPQHLKDQDFKDELKKFEADCFVVVAFRILPKEIFTIPKKGTINVHGSLLPAYRGAAPINWAIMNGDSESGVTTMLIDAKVDTGNILLQDKVEITSSMTAGDLHDILAERGAKLLVKTIDKIANGKINSIQQENIFATKAPKITTATALINFEKEAEKVHNQIRGLSPYPGAFTFLKSKKIKLLKSHVSSSRGSAVAGVILSVASDNFVVGCTQGKISIFEVQLEGKKIMSVHDFLNGHKLSKGMHFTSTKI